MFDSQIELLSIKLKDCRKQLEEARALRPDDRVFEKLRCEKRLLEDKYRTLKDKYVRLKSDVKQTLEKRNKKRLAVTGGGATTGSETDRSSSQRLGQVKSRIKIIAPPDDISSEANNNNNSGSGVDNTMASSMKESLVVSPPPTDSSDRTSPPLPLRRARRHQSKLKSSSTPRLDRGRDAALNPVDSLRTQLQKLEDLEDLFPASTHVDTYLRYPFEESGQMGSCELEFFRHRIHLERDSVQKAKAFLKQQRHTFANRQRELHKRQSQITLSPSPTSSRLHSELAKDSIIQVQIILFLFCYTSKN
jgi:centrosomal protein CEP164